MSAEAVGAVRTVRSFVAETVEFWKCVHLTLP
jgi:hypothetical protein